MSTRKAIAGTPFRQERYCSSAQLERGLMANLVATRCDALDCAEDRDLIYFLQLLSHREGGLKKFAGEVRQRFAGRIGTKSMRKFGMKPGQVYNAEQVKSVRRELGDDCGSFPLRGDGCNSFPLRGESLPTWYDLLDVSEDELARRKAESAAYPASYTAEEFISLCRHAFQMRLEDDLKKLCLDPGEGIAGHSLWYFHELIPCLREYQAAWIEQRRAATVVTALGQLVYDTLDFTLESKCLTLIDGLARTGKTFAAKSWVELHPGRARYVQVPSTNDDIGFFRAIAKSLGVSINLNSKAQELRQRIEEVLQRGDLAIVFDEAHYLWPNSNYRDAMPQRVNWIMTALVNHGVPVSLVTTPQFLRTQKAVERKSSWTSEQFVGRIGHYQKLPDSLSEADLNHVAASLLPEGDDKAREILVRYAQGSAKYLAGIESVVRRARYLAGKEGRLTVRGSDLKRAIQESVIPSDSALAHAIAEPEKPARKRRSSLLKPSLTSPSVPVLEGAGDTGETQIFTTRRPGGRADLDRPIPLHSGRDLVPA